MSDFSLQCAVLSDTILPSAELLSKFSQSFQTLLLLYQLSLCNILPPCYCLNKIFIASLPGVDSISWNHLLCSSTSSSSSSVQILSWDCTNSVIFQAPFLILVLLLFLLHLHYFPHWSLKPSKSFIRVGISLFQTLLMLIFWPLPMNHKCSEQHLEWWILSEDFLLTLPKFIRCSGRL